MADEQKQTQRKTTTDYTKDPYLPTFNTGTDEQSLTAARISTNLANYEAARSGFFTLIVPDLNNIPRVNYTGAWENAAPSADSKNVIAQAEESLRLNVIKFDVPHFSVAVHEYRRGNDVVKYAGIPTFGQGNLVVDDIVGIDTKSILMAWQNLTYNVRSRKGGRMVNYKRDCTLTEYTQDYEIVRSWTLYGCFISALSEDSFDRNNDGPRQITATIEYDRAEMQLPDDETAITTGTDSNTTQTQG